MRQYFLTLDCHNCGTTMKNPVTELSTDKILEIPVSIIEQEVFTCPECDTVHYLGDILASVEGGEE